MLSRSESALDIPGPPMEAFSTPLNFSQTSAAATQISILMDKMDNHAADADRKRDSDRRAFERRFQQVAERRFQQLEQKATHALDLVQQQASGDVDARTKLADLQGSVQGLSELLKNLTQRLDDMWSRTSGIDLIRHRSQELEQQVQSLEQSSRLAESSKEEVRKRESARLRRMERTMEDVCRRFSQTEDALQSQLREYPSVSQTRREQEKEADEVRHRLGWLEQELLEGELRQRVEFLEETQASETLPQPQAGTQHGREVAQAQDSICDLTEQLSHLRQRASCTEQALTALQQHVQRLSPGDSRDHGSNSTASRTVASLQAELGAMSLQVTDVAARVVDLEGSLEFGQSEMEGSLRGPAGGREAGNEAVGSEALSTNGQVAQGARVGPNVDTGEALSVLDERLQKLEEETSLYWDYTKSAAEQSCQDVQELVRRLIDVEDMQQHLHDVECAAPSGPRSIAEQLDDVRQQVALLRGSPDHEPHGSGDMARSQRQRLNSDEAARLYAVEERVEASFQVAASQTDKILQRVSEEWENQRLDLEEQRASVSALSDQVMLIDGRSRQCLSANNPTSALGTTIAAFCKDFKLQSDALEVLNDEDLENVEAALEQMQGTCLQAADHIASSVQCQLRALCGQDVSFEKTLLPGAATPPSPGSDSRSSDDSERLELQHRAG